MILNNLYRAIAMLGVVGAFVFGALVNSGIEHEKSEQMTEFLMQQPIQALVNMIVIQPKASDI